jgi:hypothetical protein
MPPKKSIYKFYRRASDGTATFYINLELAILGSCCIHRKNKMVLGLSGRKIIGG